MIQRFELYLPKSKKNVRILVSIPKGYDSMNIEFDSLYMLDGQNIYKDHEAAFGRSLRMGKYLAIMATKFQKNIVGIAIFNAGSDLGRVNEYTPFELEGPAKNIWPEQDVSISENYSYDLIHTIVPYIQNRYPVRKEAEHTFIMGSSLGGLYASYLVNAYPDTFKGAGIFSNAPFLCEKSYYSFLENNLNREARNFIYVGMNEESDGEFGNDCYLSHSIRLHEFNKSNNVKSKLVIDYYGIHNEANWEKHVLEFLSFMYFDDIEITV